MPKDDPARAMLEAALQRADGIIIEGRNSVHGLRLEEKPNSDLQVVLEEVLARAQFSPSTAIRVLIEGKSRSIDPAALAEIKKLAGEALFNAARHACASRVDVLVIFADRQFEFHIRDDGKGIDSEVLEKGYKEGHFGLIGMRERVERIGAALEIHSSESQGTEIVLSLPAEVAYRGKEPRGSVLSLFKKRLSRL
jgi:signal transduction histidine kinase